jgi:tetratricopeptide (TPR) repeat protein
MRRLGAAALTLLLLCPLSGYTETAVDMDKLYDNAVAAFEQGRYRDALDSFLRLRARGFDEPALYFNLGSTYYRLHYYEQAEKAFLKATEAPDYAGIAWYNIALSAYRRGDEASAALAVERASASTSDEEVLALAETLRTLLDKNQSMPSTYSGLLIVGAGYNDNVTLRVADETLGTSEQGDTFLDVAGHLELHPSKLKRHGITLHGDSYLLNHRSLHEYNTSELQVGVGYEWKTQYWLGSLETRLEQIFLDGQGFTRMAGARMQGRHLLSEHSYLELAYEAGAVRAVQPGYRYLDGMQHRIETVFSMRTFDSYALQLGYGLELNDRNDVITPLFTSFSPTRHTLRADVTRMLSPRIAARLSVHWRYSRYNDPNEFDDGSRHRRRDERTHIAGRLSYLFNNGRDLALELQHTVNESNISAYAYTRSQYLLNVLVSW